MLLLPHADKEQKAAFVRDERVLIVWSDDLDAIIPACRDLEDRLIKLLWRSRPAPVPGTPLAPSSYAGSVASGHIGNMHLARTGSALGASAPGSSETGAGAGLLEEQHGGSQIGSVRARRVGAGAMGDLEKGMDEEDEEDEKELAAGAEGAGGRRWLCCGKRGKQSPAARRRKERARVEERSVRIIAPIYNGIAAGLAICKWFLPFMCGER